ncbi:hypothetical protein FRC06_006400 [Ceratobasidium sp. 370]|nr:hypothetical protein FRC06_006400 [Ceratobasidium sp. 370]
MSLARDALIEPSQGLHTVPELPTSPQIFANTTLAADNHPVRDAQGSSNSTEQRRPAPKHPKRNRLGRPTPRPMTSVQTAPGLPLALPTHRSRFLVSASSLRLLHTPPSPTQSVGTPSSASSTGRTTPVSRRKRFSPVSVTHTTILGHAASTKVVSLGTVDLAAVLRHAANTRVPDQLVRPRSPEPEEPEPATKDTRERPRYRVPPSPLPAAHRSKPSSTPRPAPISLVRPRAQFPLYLPILDSRIPPVELPSLESIEAAAAAQALATQNQDQGRRSARARRPASRTLEYLSSEPATAVPVSRKRRADTSNGSERRELRTSKRARKDVNYIIPSLASIDREMGQVRPRRARRRSEASLSEESETKPKDAEPKEDSPLSVDDDKARRPRARQAN